MDKFKIVVKPIWNGCWAVTSWDQDRHIGDWCRLSSEEATRDRLIQEFTKCLDKMLEEFPHHARGK